MTGTDPQRRAAPLVFDAVLLARVITARRAALGLSTREVAGLAGISQSYVVALEHGRRTPPTRPTPTADVVVRLAHALGLTPIELFQASLGQPGRHVMLVCDSAASLSVDQLVAASGHHGPWVWAAAQRSRSSEPSEEIIDIDVRRRAGAHYRPAAVTSALHDEMARAHDHVAGRDLGLAFVETAQVLETIDDPELLLDFEHEWTAVVRAALATHQARDLWNVCVYTPSALRRFDDPAAAALRLLDVHDSVWWFGADELLGGRAAARSLLSGLRPAGTDEAGWTRHVDRLVSDLDLAA